MEYNPLVNLDAHTDVVAIDDFYSQMANFGKCTELLHKLICWGSSKSQSKQLQTAKVAVAMVAACVPSSPPIDVCDSAGVVCHTNEARVWCATRTRRCRGNCGGTCPFSTTNRRARFGGNRNGATLTSRSDLYQAMS